MTREQCMQFVENPREDPRSIGKKKGVQPGSGPYNELVKQCMRVLGEEGIPAIIASNVLKSNPTRATLHGNQQACLRMINESADMNESNPRDLKIADPFMMNKEPRSFPIESKEAQLLLETCKNQFGLVVLDIHIQESEQHRVYIPVYLHHDNNLGRIMVSNQEIVSGVVAAIIEKWTLRTHDTAVYDSVIDGVQRLIDSNYLYPETKVSLEDMVMELQAMKMGVVIGKASPESSLSSSVKSANRSKSKSVKSGMSPLPKKDRAEILKDLEKACIDMQDMITLEDFTDPDMKKKKLQLIIGIGPKNKEGQQRCYHVKNIYNFIKSAVKQGLVPKEPMSKVPITQHEIDTVIMPKMRYIKPDARDPGHIEKRTYPRLTLDITTIEHRGRPYFQIELKRLIGAKVHWKRLIGFIAADIETESADINSYAVIAKVRDLFDKGRLVDHQMRMRVHLNKSVDYWDNEPERKLHHMVEELSTI